MTGGVGVAEHCGRGDALRINSEGSVDEFPDGGRVAMFILTQLTRRCFVSIKALFKKLDSEQH